MQHSYDIIIVGAGVIGLAQAVALTAVGFKVAVVDAQASPCLNSNTTFDVRVFALNRFSEHCLKKWGIWSNVEYRRFAAYHQVALAFQSSQTDLTFYASDDAEPNLGCIVEQSVLRQAAFEKLTVDAQCDFFWQQQLQEIEQDAHGVRVTFAHSQNLTQTLHCHAKLLIGADGMHSRVRTLSNISVDTYPCHQTAVAFNIHIEKSHQFSAAQYFSPQGIVAFLPLDDPHYFSIVWSLPNDLMQQHGLTDEALAALLNKIVAQKWGALSITSQRLSFPLTQMQAATYFSAKTVLIGDAAHTIHPLAGQGANLGIADIEALTERLLWAKAEGRPIFDETVLRKAMRHRRAAAWQMMGLMSGFASCAGQSVWLNQLLSVGASVINRLPLLKNFLSRFALYQFTK